MGPPCPEALSKSGSKTTQLISNTQKLTGEELARGPSNRSGLPGPDPVGVSGTVASRSLVVPGCSLSPPTGSNEPRGAVCRNGAEALGGFDSRPDAGKERRGSLLSRSLRDGREPHI